MEFRIHESALRDRTSLLPQLVAGLAAITLGMIGVLLFA
jgi:hypothetical protein